MADSEKREIASLDFDITKGIQQLKTLSDTINSISQNTETQFKNMSNTIEKNIKNIPQIISSQNLNLDKIQFFDSKKTYSDLGKIAEKYKLTGKQIASEAKKVFSAITEVQTANTKSAIKNKENEYSAYLRVLTHQEKADIDYENQKKKSDLRIAEHKEKMLLREENSQNSFLDKMKNYAQAFIGFQGLDALRQSAVDFVDTMKSVESRMSEISRIMEDGTIDVQNYRDEIIQLGYDYSRTFDEVSTVTLNFARAGYNAQESLAMTEKSLLALNTAELDANEATDGLISIMAQWGLNTGTATEKAQKLESIIDKINKTADNFPVSSEGLLQALQRTSQGFNLAGASIDETIALIVAAETAAQRGGKEIGTAMANIIQQLKAEGKLNLAEELGLDFYEDDAKTVFKSITDIFAEMSERMAQLKEEGKESSTEMQSLLELFTVFRRNIGAGLLSEMEGEDSTYVKALETSMNALNYSAEENSKYMNTAEAATKRFQDTLLQLQTTIWDESGEGFFYTIINSGEGLINILNKLIDTFGGIPTVIGAATLAYTAFNKQLQAQVTFKDGKFNVGFSGTTVDNIKKASEEVKNLQLIMQGASRESYKFSDSFKQYINNVGLADASTKGYIGSLVKQKAATIAAQTATVALQGALSLGLSAAITVVISLISDLINGQKEYIESNNQIIQNSKDKIQELQNESETITDVMQKYKELSQSEVRTPEVNKEIISLQEQIEESLGGQSKSIDLINGKYSEQLLKLNQILDENRKIEIENAKSANIAAQANYNVGTDQFKVDDIFKGFGEENYNALLDQANGDLESAYDILKNRQEELNNIIENLKETIENTPDMSENESLFNSMQLSTYENELQVISEKLPEIKEKIDAVTESEDTLNNLLAEDYFADNIQGNITSLQDFQEAIDNINQMPLMEGFKGDINDQKELLRGLIEREYPELAQKLNELNADKFEESFNKNANGIKDNIESIIKELEGLSTEDILQLETYGTDEQKASFESLRDVADEYNMSLSQLLSSLEELGLVQGSATGTTAEFKSEAEQLKEVLSGTNDAFDALETAMNSYNQNGELTNDEVLTMLENTPQLAKYLIKVGDTYKLNENALKDYNAVQENTNALVDEYIKKLQEEQFGTKEFAETYNEFLDAITEQYDFESIKNLSEQVKEINQTFIDGESTASEYFNSLQEHIANIGEIKIVDGEQATEEIEGMQAVFAAFTQSTAEGIEYIQAQFESGQMNFEDYSLSMQEATDNIIDLYAKANDLTFDDQTQQWLDSSGAVNEYANSLQNAKDELEGFNQVLSSIYDNSEFLKGSLTDLGTVAIDSALVGTEAYNNYVNSFSAGLDFMVQRNNEAYNAIVSAVEGVVGYTINTSDELKYAIAGNAEALSAATNESAKQTGNSLGKLTQSAGNVIDALGKVIANFKYSITIVPSGGLKFSLENLLKGGNAFVGSGLKLNLYGQGGGSVSQLAGALQSFGSDLASLNFGSVNIGNILNAGSYTPSSYSRPYTPSYSSGSSGGGSRGGSRGSGGGSSRGSGSSSTTEKNTILQDFKDAIAEREDEEQRWVDKQKELNQLSLNDQKYILQQEIERYKKYADEVMQLAGVTEEEKLEVKKEYLQKAEDLELDYIKLLEDELNDAIDAIEKKYDERIDKINETADAEIEALQKVEDENDRIREKEDYLARRDEIIHGNQGIEYWEQRTGREAQLALAEARKELEELDKEWQEKQEDWNTEDQIQAIEDRRDAEIEAAQAAMEAEIEALQATYDYRVKQFAETGKIIFDEATIQSKALYNTYKTNFIDPVGSELRDALNQYASTQTTSTSSSRDYTIQWGDTLTGIASRFGTTIAKIMAANPWITNADRIYAGNVIKIPSSHTGSKVLKDGAVELQAGEVVLNTKWARDLDRMLEQYSRTSTNNTQNTINQGSTLNVKGDMIKIEANIEDKSDINTLTRKMERALAEKFSIK